MVVGNSIFFMIGIFRRRDVRRSTGGVGLWEQLLIFPRAYTGVFRVGLAASCV